MSANAKHLLFMPCEVSRGGDQAGTTACLDDALRVFLGGHGAREGDDHGNEETLELMKYAFRFF